MIIPGLDESGKVRRGGTGWEWEGAQTDGGLEWQKTKTNKGERKKKKLHRGRERWGSDERKPGATK